MSPGERHIVSAGVGYALDTWTLSASYGLIILQSCERTFSNGRTSAEGDFDDGFCQLIALSVAKSFWRSGPAEGAGRASSRRGAV